MNTLNTILKYAALLIVLPIVAATAADTPAAGTPRTAIPDDHNFKSRVDYQTCWEDYLATKKGKPCDLLFIGDSITMNFRWNIGKPVWAKYYADRALDFGQSWDTTQNTLWRLKNLDIKDFKPKAAVVLIGTNNVKDKAEDIAAGVKAIADTARSMFPGVKVILVSILPNGRAKETMDAANAIIQTYADNQSVFYLNLAAKFTPVGENWKGLGIDRLHPTLEGYEMWAAELNPLLDKIAPQPIR
ncbi:MAG: GDSL-type esterase/lipase family protein [Chthoniobacteraceae bacterium]|nr:GDSL-type esterase/lipase family protein [Chthoniobacteraceae bacterium]